MNSPDCHSIPSRSLVRVQFIATCAAVLLAQVSVAQTIRPNPDPGVVGEGFVDYVGRFGEVFKLRGGWQIDSFMNDGTEVINLYPTHSASTPEYSLELFKPKPSDFVPENFAQLGLIQLIIIPRPLDAFRSLDDLKKEKIRDLVSSGVRFEVLDHPHFPAFRGNWPAGTFEIKVRAPYLLTQLYTATSSHTCILTAGIDTPPSTRIRDHYSFLRYGLAEWVVPQEPPVRRDEDTPSGIFAKGITLHPFTVPAVWLSWAAITGIACLLGGLGIQQHWNVLRRVSLSILIFSNTGALLGGALGLVFWPFAWFSHHATIPAGVACLLMPALALLLNRTRPEADDKRRSLWLSLWALAVAAFMAYCGSYDWGGGDTTRYLLAYNAILGFVSYAIGGIIYGILDSSLNGISHKRSLLFMLLMFLSAASAHSESSSAQDTDAKARALLADRKETEDKFEERAVENLKKTRAIYDYQRVEIKGILSKNSADNNTNDTFGPMFDLQVAPTHLENAKDGVLPEWIRTPRNVLNDLKSLNKDARNQLSAAAEEAVKQLQQKEVREIVAHSWGTEIVYNAILSGKISPPQRLIVCGMPDRDLEKWKALSKYTGTEVVVYTNSHDAVAGTARIIEGFAYESSQSLVHGHLEEFEVEWQNACKAIDCNPHRRKAPAPVYRNDYKGLTHDRLAHYQAMVDAGDLPMQPAESTLFGKYDEPFPGSAKELQAAQNALITAERHRLYIAAVNRERERIEADLLNADASFFSGLQDIERTMSERAKSMLAQNVLADELAVKKAQEDAIREEAEAYAREKQRIWDEIENTKRAEKYVQALADEACANPDRMAELAAAQAIVPTTDLWPAYLSGSYNSADTSGPGSLSACQMWVLDQFDDVRRAGGRALSSDFATWSIRYHNMHPGLGKRLAASSSKFFSSLSKLLAISPRSGDSRSSGSGRTGKRPPPKSPSPPRGGDQCTHTYIPELNQTITTCPVY